MSKILVVEDEADLSETIREWLVEDNYVVEVAGDGGEAIKFLTDHSYDLIILDLMLPNISGMDVCRKYRAGGGKAGILMLTAKKSLESKEEGLDAGADDYLTKPFQLRELSARVRAVLRRLQSVSTSTLAVADILLDPNTCRVTKAGQEIHLLPKEFVLLELLMRTPNKVLSSDELIDNVWGKASLVVPDNLRTYIKNLRKKLAGGEGPSLIRTVHGVGYAIEDRSL